MNIANIVILKFSAVNPWSIDFSKPFITITKNGEIKFQVVFENGFEDV